MSIVTHLKLYQSICHSTIQSISTMKFISVALVLSLSAFVAARDCKENVKCSGSDITVAKCCGANKYGVCFKDKGYCNCGPDCWRS